MDKNSLNELKKEYQEIEIPSELKNNIQMGIERGKRQMKKNSGNKFLKVCAGFVIAFTVITAGINTSPAFAHFCEELPYIGKLVSVLKFNDGKASGGSLTDGTDISVIDSFKNAGYENIIINFSQNDEAQESVGSFNVKYNENPYTMTFEIGGARRFSAEEDFEKLRENKFVKDVYKIITLDDSLIRFVIEFTGPVEYQVKELKDPASIVLALKEDKQYEEKKTYSLRTESYFFGETLGVLEEQLMVKDETRILKDDNDLFFVEIQSFDTKSEAEKKLNELSKLTDKTLVIEEREGTTEAKSYPAEETKKN